MGISELSGLVLVPDRLSVELVKYCYFILWAVELKRLFLWSSVVIYTRVISYAASSHSVGDVQEKVFWCVNQTRDLRPWRWQILNFRPSLAACFAAMTRKVSALAWREPYLRHEFCIDI